MRDLTEEIVATLRLARDLDRKFQRESDLLEPDPVRSFCRSMELARQRAREIIEGGT